MNKSIIKELSLAGCLCTAVLAPAHASGPYDNVVTAEVLPGWETPEGGQMAGLRLTLAPGWKTYWRAPGDAGIPPGFDWSGSENIRAVTLHWPRPNVYYQNGMRSLGYKHEVVIPLELTLNEPGQPVILDGRVRLGVCLDICMPVELDLRAALPAAPDAAPIRAALDARPVSAAKAGVRAISCAAQPIEDGMRLTARITVPALGTDEIAVVEMADPSIWVAESEVSRDGDALTAVTDLVPTSEAPFALDGADIRITLLSGDAAIDIQGCAVN